MLSDDYEGFESRWISIGGYRVHVRCSVDPPEGALPVVLAHGLGVSSRHWMPAARLLARTHPVIAPDLPGTGRSEKPRRALTLIQLADMLADCMDELGVGPAAVLGVSFGCQIVIDLAVQHPSKVVAAVLVAPTMDPRMGPIEHFVRLLVDAPREPLSLFPVVARDYLEFGVPRALATLNDASQDEILDEAELVGVPTLVVRGGRDPIVSREWVERLAAALPDGEVAEIAGAAHATNFNSAGEVVDLVEAWLASAAPAPADEAEPAAGE